MREDIVLGNIDQHSFTRCNIFLSSKSSRVLATDAESMDVLSSPACKISFLFNSKKQYRVWYRIN